MGIRIKAKHLAAVSYGIASQDVRYYLNGIHLATYGADKIRLETTDGHIAFRVETDTPSLLSDDGLILGGFTVDQLRDLRKRGNAEREVEFTLNGVVNEGTEVHTEPSTMTLNGVVSPISVIDGRFPDLNKIWPVTFTGSLGDNQGLSLDFLTLAAKAERAINSGHDHPAVIYLNSDGATRLSFANAKELSMVIMPMRI